MYSSIVVLFFNVSRVLLKLNLVTNKVHHLLEDTVLHVTGRVVVLHMRGAHIRGHGSDRGLRMVAERLVGRRVGVQAVVVVVGGGAAVESMIG